jgi:hypothetical protein
VYVAKFKAEFKNKCTFENHIMSFVLTGSRKKETPLHAFLKEAIH